MTEKVPRKRTSRSNATRPFTGLTFTLRECRMRIALKRYASIYRFDIRVTRMPNAHRAQTLRVYPTV